MTPTKTVLIFSGGLDSTILLDGLLAARNEVHALSFDYGQRHRRRELDAARAIVAHYRARGFPLCHDVVDLRGVGRLLAAGGSALVDPSVSMPEGHYAAETMKATVVPNRNLIMLSIAAGVAMAGEADRVAYGAHAGDHTIYPDCRPEFARAVDAALALADWHPVSLYAPFANMTKAEIVMQTQTGAARPPLALTWSCYAGGMRHCGRCGTCVERREAFALAGETDPTEYETC